MSESHYYLWNVFLQAVTIAVSAVVGWIVWRYTRETQKLRETAEDQVKLMREEAKRVVKPYLLAKITNYAAGARSSTNTVGADVVRDKYMCRVWNVTDRPANNINLLIRNRSRGFYWSDKGVDVLGEMDPLADGALLRVSGPMDMESGLGAVTSEYGQASGPHLDVLTKQNGDYSALFFRDVNGRLYMALRVVTILEQPFRQEANHIIE